MGGLSYIENLRHFNKSHYFIYVWKHLHPPKEKIAKPPAVVAKVIQEKKQWISHMQTTRKKLTTRHLRQHKAQLQHRKLSMLTCYDYQTAQLLQSTEVDTILVGDSAGNVLLGHSTTIPVRLSDMILFGQAVRRGAPEKFLILDMPFGTYAEINHGVQNAIQLFQETSAEALKVEGATPNILQTITRLVEIGIPIIGHIGLTPQSIHQLGGAYIHGKDTVSKAHLLDSARQLQNAGVTMLVLECIDESVAQEITAALSIPTIGIGSGQFVDGHVLVINDLFHLGADDPPKFCTPLANLFQMKRELLQKYLITSTQVQATNIQ